MMLLYLTQRRAVIAGRSIRHVRCYTVPPRKSFTSNLTPLEVVWNQKIPIGVKYGASLITIAVGIANLHFNTLVTVIPPFGVGSYFIYKRMLDWQYQREVEKIKPGSDVKLSNTVEIQPYVETDIKNVLNGIENEYDHFRLQVYKIVESAIKSNMFESGLSDLFLDSNNQFKLQLDPPENMVTLTIDYENETVKFVKLGIPFVDKQKQRLGIVEVYLMELPQLGPTTYKARIRVTPYGYSQPTFDIEDFEQEPI